MAYLRATYRFATLCETQGLALEKVEPMFVAAYIEQLTMTRRAGDRETTPGSHTHAVRLARGWLGRAVQPGQFGVQP